MPSQRGSKWVVIGTVAGLTVAGVLVAVGIAFGPTARSSDLWFEVAKAGVSLGVIAVLGGVVGLLLREVERERDEQRHERDFQRDFYLTVRGAYFELKDVRRRLRAAGVPYSGHPAPTGSLPAIQVDEIRSAMHALVRAQLRFEAAAREVCAERERYPSHTVVLDALQQLGRYGSAAAAEWDEIGGSLWPDCDASSLVRFVEIGVLLTHKSTGGTFEADAGSQMERITAAFFPPRKSSGQYPGTGHH